MPDNRDFRVRINLTFDPADEGVARGIYNHCKNQMSKAVNISVDAIPDEISFVSLELCGHRLGVECEEIAREEIP